MGSQTKQYTLLHPCEELRVKWDNWHFGLKIQITLISSPLAYRVVLCKTINHYLSGNVFILA